MKGFYLCQVALRGTEDWQTVCSTESPSAWRAQCASRYRRNGYRTRVVTA